VTDSREQQQSQSSGRSNDDDDGDGGDHCWDENPFRSRCLLVSIDKNDCLMGASTNGAMARRSRWRRVGVWVIVILRNEDGVIDTVRSFRDTSPQGAKTGATINDSNRLFAMTRSGD
jgi:hypothetical protein